MFEVVNRAKKEVHTVYDVKREGTTVLFLIHDKTYGWHYYNADSYIPAEEYFNGMVYSRNSQTVICRACKERR
ncbi:MAG: hypothetical protein K5675_04850 [Lachnospiraceae bacterium]|nr:hypothetical protein [Lachnospiraceae bacterium]